MHSALLRSLITLQLTQGHLSPVHPAAESIPRLQLNLALDLQEAMQGLQEKASSMHSALLRSLVTASLEPANHAICCSSSTRST